MNSIPGKRTDAGDLTSECNQTWDPYTKGVYIPEMETDINQTHPQINTNLQLCGYCERGEKNNTLNWKEEDLMDKKAPPPLPTSQRKVTIKQKWEAGARQNLGQSEGSLRSVLGSGACV